VHHMVVGQLVVSLLDDICRRQTISSSLLNVVLFDHTDDQAQVI